MVSVLLYGDSFLHVLKTEEFMYIIHYFGAQNALDKQNFVDISVLEH